MFNMIYNLESMLSPWFIAIVLVAIAWKFYWYGLALWHNIENKNKKHFMIFFVLMFVINDLGLVPIIYLAFNKKHKNKLLKKLKKNK
jgi:uncharacterized protein DUF5652